MKNLILLLVLFLILQKTFASEAIGFYSSGSLVDGIHIQNETEDIDKLFVNRKRFYTTQEMADLLVELNTHMKALDSQIETLQLGDLSKDGGGKVVGHKSHQNGLDADVVYYQVDFSKQSPKSSSWKHNFVYKNKVTQNFHMNNNWEALKFLVQTKTVNRIFVDWAVKKAYCQNKEELYQNDTKEVVDEVLRRLRPAKHHKTHFHIRMFCPSKDTRCKDQAQPVKGTACREAINGPPKPVQRPRDHQTRRRDRR